MAAPITELHAETPAVADPAAAFYAAVREHNDRARLLAREGRCGGCIGAGKGPTCRICGGAR
jgi:hypothetical protein